MTAEGAERPRLSERGEEIIRQLRPRQNEADLRLRQDETDEPPEPEPNPAREQKDGAAPGTREPRLTSAGKPPANPEIGPPGGNGPRADEESDAAEESLRITAKGPPVPDPGMFYGLPGDIVSAAVPHTEADPVGILVSLLAGVGVVIGPTPHLLIGSTRHPLLLWPLLFGSTGTGRKGEASETAALFLLRSYPDASVLMVSGLSSGEGLIERIRDKADKSQDEEGRTNSYRACCDIAVTASVA